MRAQEPPRLLSILFLRGRQISFSQRGEGRPLLTSQQRSISRLATVFHSFQKDIFQRIPLVSQPPNLYLRLPSQPVNVANLSARLQNYFQPIIAGDGAFASQRVDPSDKLFQIATRLEHQELH